MIIAITTMSMPARHTMIMAIIITRTITIIMIMTMFTTSIAATLMGRSRANSPGPAAGRAG